MDIKKIIREEVDDFDWAKEQVPIELQDPTEWVGRTFGYGDDIIETMSDGDIFHGNDGETFTIMGIDDNGNLSLKKNHPVYGETSDIATSVRTLREYINSGYWLWVS